MSDIPLERAEILEDFAKEVKILSLLSHPRIIRFLGAIQRSPNYCLLTELLSGSVSSLLKLVDRKKARVTWNIVLTIAKDAADACNYLHTLEPQILHRDLKAENLLIDEHFRCKLSDFGLSRAFDTGGTMTVCGTPSWVAPEIFRGERYTEKIDIYSYSIVMWELFCFKKPHQDQDTIELPYLVGKKGLRPPVPIHFPPKLKSLIQECWRENPDQRPSFEEILKQLNEVEQECKGIPQGLEAAVKPGKPFAR
jgi:serine/threonine protein kinase